MISVKSRTLDEIEALARREVEDCYPDQVPVPVIRYLDGPLATRIGYLSDIEDSIALRGLHGVTNFRTKRIQIPRRVYDRAYRNDPDARFTIAHEIGHAVTHGDEVSRFLDTFDDPAQMPLVNQQCVPEDCNPESQANAFACAFLMPKSLIERELKRTRQDRARKRLMPAEFGELVRQMAALFAVSPAVAMFRLNYVQRGAVGAPYQVRVVYGKTETGLNGFVPVRHAFRDAMTLCGISQESFPPGGDISDDCVVTMCHGCQAQIDLRIGGSYHSRYFSTHAATRCGCFEPLKYGA